MTDDIPGLARAMKKRLSLKIVSSWFRVLSIKRMHKPGWEVDTAQRLYLEEISTYKSFSNLFKEYIK